MNVAAVADKVYQEVGKAVVGQSQVVEQVFVAFLADGHCLLEGVPGLAKTLLVRTLAQAAGLDFKRIQFTPDLMPSDVSGTNVFDMQASTFSLRPGPIFTSVLLADEINRTPPKTQAALLEAMEERTSTIDGVSYRLPYPFLVFATQNPVEHEGTYPLPEAQQDRFLFKIMLDYPAAEQEVEVYRRHHEGFRTLNLDEANVQPVLNAETLQELRRQVEAVKVEDKIFQYIYDIVKATRRSMDVMVGGSPRAGIAMVRATKALAATRDRDFVIPDDVKELAVPILRHRIMLRPETEIEGRSVDQVLTELVGAQSVPR